MLVLAVALAAVGPVSAEPSAEAADTETVVVRLFCQAGDGSTQPLPGVAIFIAGSGDPWVVGTNHFGIAKFGGVDTGVDLSIVTENQWQPDPICENLEFMNPDTGQKMFQASARPTQVAAGGEERVCG